MPPNHSNGNSTMEMAQSSQDLIITKGKRKKRAWIIGSVLALIVIALVVTAVVLLTADKEEIVLSKNTLSLEDVLEGRLAPKVFNASWISDNQLFYKDAAGDLVVYNAHNQTKTQVLPSSSIPPLLSPPFQYDLSPDKDYILFAYDYQKLYRHTYLSRYTILNLRTQEEVRVGVTISGEFQDLLQYATWSPVGNSLAFVFQNNIYYKASVYANAVALTTDGKEGHIYNGVPDWVYEEEIFSSNNVIYFSNDGKKIAYAKFDDTNVPLMTIPFYGIPGSLASQYTKAVQIRYPKPGTTNPQVTLHVADVTTAATTNLQIPSSLNQPLLTAIAWATDEILTAIWMNRVQNEAYIVGYESSETSFQTYKHLSQNNGWVEQFTPPVFSSSSSEFLIILSQDQGGNAGSYRHLVKLNMKENSDVDALTSGKFVVTDILDWDEDKDLVYYEANTEEDPGSMHVYSVSTKTKQTTCLSCDLKNKKGDPCDYNSAKFSQDSSFYIMNCAGPGVPEITLYNEDHQKINTWEDNQDLLEISDEKTLPTIKRFTFDVADGFQAQVMLKVPPGADLSGDTKYPMVVSVYGGPDSYLVVNKYSVDWGSYLAANKSIIYATIDGRGSGLKGDKILFSGYRNLGTVEIEDQINVTRLIQQNVPYVDASRTAIWGWSYGGYASGLALAKDTQNVFKCAMSVAPVTDWTLYDSIYTERYMGLPVPDDNIVGYENAKLLNKFEGLRDKQYFLIHGTFDDNVHYQQSMLWSKVLEHQDILFRQQSYPDEDHGLASVRPHLYHSLEHFLDECFDVE